jgi:hypothetical protein
MRTPKALPTTAPTSTSVQKCSPEPTRKTGTVAAAPNATIQTRGRAALLGLRME